MGHILTPSLPQAESWKKYLPKLNFILFLANLSKSTSFFCSSFWTCSADSCKWKDDDSDDDYDNDDDIYDDNDGKDDDDDTDDDDDDHLWIEARVWQELSHDECVVNFPSLNKFHDKDDDEIHDDHSWA